MDDIRIKGKKLTYLALIAIFLLGTHDGDRSESRARPGRASIVADKLMQDPRAMLKEANRLSWLLNWHAAEPLYTSAEEAFRSTGDTRDELYARVGRLRAQFDRISFSEISRSLRQVLQNPATRSDPRLRMWCLVNKGYVDLSIDLLSAKADWAEALKIAIKLGENQWKTRALGELGVVSFLEGNTSKAADQVGYALFSATASGDIGAQIRFSDMLGTGLNEIHRYSEAIPFFERAIKLGNNRDVGFPFMAYEREAEALLELGKVERAQILLQEVLNRARLEQRAGPEMQVLILQGRLNLQRGNHSQALQDLESASRIARNLSFYRMVACAMYDLASAYNSLGEFAKAEASMSAAIEASRRVGDRLFVPRDLTAMASLKAQHGDVQAADALYREAEDVIDGMLVNMHMLFWKKGLGAALSNTYLQHFRLVAASNNVDKALQILERVRGRTAAAMLQNRTSTTPETALSFNDLEDQIANVQVKLMKSREESDRTDLLNQLLDYERRLILRQNESASSQNGFLGKPTSLRAVQAALNQHELLLEYVMDEPHSFCISISKSEAAVTMLKAGGAKITALTKEYLSAIQARKPATEVARELYSILIEPIPKQKGKDRLIIAPDGYLYFLAFETLRDSTDQYLLNSHVVTYTPAAAVLQTIRASRPSHQPMRSLLAIGDVEYGDLLDPLSKNDSTDTRASRGLYDMAGTHFGSLPHTREEVLAVSRSMGGPSVVLLGSDATEAAFKSQPLEQFKVIHMAVHGLASTEIPERAALILGRKPGTSDDGLLQVREITHLRLNADLVTLSACNTGVGTLNGESGVSNLEEAFLTAGAKAVVASLWAVDDTYTTALMTRFYQNLAERQDKALALQRAKLDMLLEYGSAVSPFYWGAFVLVGDGASPISFEKTGSESIRQKAAL